MFLLDESNTVIQSEKKTSHLNILSAQSTEQLPFVLKSGFL